MKKLPLLIAVFALTGLIGTDAFAGRTSFGAKTGMILSNITQTPVEWENDKSFKAGFTGGVFLNYALNDRFSLQPEILYTMKGVKANLYDGWILVDVTASFDYIELPLLAVYSFGGGGKFEPFLYGGPAVAFTLSSELELSASIFSASTDFSSLTHTTDFCLFGGGGFNYSIGGRTFLVDARFQMGLTNVIMSGDFEINGSTQTIDEDDFKNYGFALMLGYVF